MNKTSCSVSPEHIFPRSIIGGATNLQSISQQENGAPGKDGRAPRGSVRKAVIKAMLANPEGLVLSAVGTAALEIDPSISIGGINNELNRQKGIIYTNEGGVWRLMPGLNLGGDFYDLLGSTES